MNLSACQFVSVIPIDWHFILKLSNISIFSRIKQYFKNVFFPISQEELMTTYYSWNLIRKNHLLLSPFTTVVTQRWQPAINIFVAEIMLMSPHYQEHMWNPTVRLTIEQRRPLSPADLQLRTKDINFEVTCELWDVLLSPFFVETLSRGSW